MMNAKRAHRDRGAVTAFAVIAVIGLLMAAGLVLDGGRLLAARRDAIDVGRGAARAGAQAVIPAVPGSGGTAQVDPVRAQALAQAYLARAGYQGDVTITGDTVTVTVHTRVSMVILPLPTRDVVVRANAHTSTGPSGDPAGRVP